ncbi:Methyltransferase [Candidatus Terasakiella magnetica]|nr:Methyltransferase [Candidatus Terasakiella magnetica]
MMTQQSLNVGEVFALAMRAYDAGNAVEARRLARLIVDAKPDFGGAHYLLGLIALDQDQAKKAAEHLSRAVAADPHQIIPRLALGRALEHQDNFNSAILQYRHIVAAEPGHAEANARLGGLLGRIGRIDEAIGHCRRAVEANADHAEALCTLGGLLHQQGRDQEAAGLLEHALALRPNWAVALHNYGLVLRALGRTERAVAILTGAADLRRDHGGIRANLAGALREMRRLDDARVQAERATKLAPREAEGWMELGLVRQALGAPEGAAAAFERALVVAPKSVEARWCLAEACRLMGEDARAAEHYRHCLKLDPEDRHGAALGLAQLGGETPERAPQSYVRQLFDDYAERFDTALVEKLAYRAPAVLAEVLGRTLPRERSLDVMDAGCGTGLMAPILRSLAARLDGLDLSPAMIEKARERNLYDELIVGDLVAVLTERGGRYDLLVAADVLVYLGDLAPVLRAAANALRPRGVFAFTVERDDEIGSYALGPKQRYAHAPDYVRAEAEAAGFTVAVQENVSTRQDGGHDVPGLMVVLRQGD